jgi:Regulator of G protein signaling domain
MIILRLICDSVMLQAVNRFRDNLISRDKDAWSGKKWFQIDEEVDIASVPPTVPSTVNFTEFYRDNRGTSWPSSVIRREAVEADVVSIWDKFVCDRSSTQICMSALVLENTIKRLKLLHLYGPEVFAEMLLDPLKTMKKDILPRFLLSPVYREMHDRLESVKYLPSASALNVSPPDADMKVASLAQSDIDCNLSGLDAADAVEDRLLYGEFLLYLRSIVSSENLLCLRSIFFFRELCAKSVSGSASCSYEATERAWEIYKFFIAPGSAYEISLSSRRSKEVMQYLACPHEKMFEKVQKSALSALRVHWEQYKKSPQFSKLVDKIQLSISESQLQSKYSVVSCFNFK